MDRAVTGQKSVKLRVLVAPLDWGLGHATRCIPVIRELIAAGAEVLIAGEGAQLILLKEEFPDLKFPDLKGYRVGYGKNGPELLRNLLYQAPGILRTIKEEHEWLKNIVRDEGIDAVISDNRFGLHHERIPSIFITHQLLIKTPWGRWTDGILQRRNYQYIEKFTACWVPDAPGSTNLAGDLSHPEKKPRIPVVYVGALSRLETVHEKKVKGQALVLLSGPEPQRTIFEEIIFSQLEKTALAAVVIRGIPGAAERKPSTPYVSYYNHLPASLLQVEIAKADIVIGRSGYSTVMDLARMKKKAILVPTPGQTEQEYLAKYLFEKKLAYTVSQKEFSLADAIHKAQDLGYVLEEPFVGKELKHAVGRFLEIIERNRKNEQ